MELAPGNAVPYSKLGLLREHQKKYPEAEKLLEQALEKDPNSTEALAALLNVYGDQKQPMSKAINRVNAQIAKAPKNDGSWYFFPRRSFEITTQKARRVLWRRHSN